MNKRGKGIKITSIILSAVVMLAFVASISPLMYSVVTFSKEKPTYYSKVITVQSALAGASAFNADLDAIDSGATKGELSKNIYEDEYNQVIGCEFENEGNENVDEGTSDSAWQIYSSILGFYIDTSIYSVSWQEMEVLPVYRSGEEIGAAVIRVGTARCREQVDGLFIDAILIAVDMETRKPTYTNKIGPFSKNLTLQGRSNKLSVTSKLNEEQTLISLNPIVAKNRYRIPKLPLSGILETPYSYDGDVVSNLFKENALSVNSASSSVTNEFMMEFNYKTHKFRSDYSRSRYLTNSIRQNVAMAFYSPTSNYSVDFDVNASFGAFDSELSFWSNNLIGTSNSTYSFTIDFE